MHIEELISKPSNKFVTVTLSYDEIRDIANGLYYASTKEPCDSPEQFKQAYVNAKFLFDMVKHGMIMPETTTLFGQSKQRR